MKFSIIVCTFNSEKYLEECLLSIVNQKFKDFEVIVVDSYSKDKTEKILKKYQKKLGLKIYKQDRVGISAAMNEGIRRASGDYVIHLHSDDSFYDNNVLNDVFGFLKINPDLELVYCKIATIEANGNKIGTFPEHKIFQIGFKKLLRFFNYIPHQSVFIKKDVFKKYGNFDESLSSGMDYDLWLRLADKIPFLFFNRIIANFRIHSQAESSGLKRKEKNRENKRLVKQRYLGKFEFWLSKNLEMIVNLVNRMYR